MDRSIEDMVNVELDILSPGLLCHHSLLPIRTECNRQDLPYALLRGCEVLAKHMLYRLVTCKVD